MDCPLDECDTDVEQADVSPGCSGTLASGKMSARAISQPASRNER